MGEGRQLQAGQRRPRRGRARKRHARVRRAMARLNIRAAAVYSAARYRHPHTL